MPFGSGLNPSAVKTAIDEFFFSKFDYAEQPGFTTAENPLLFKQQTSGQSAEITEEFGMPGEFLGKAESEAGPEATIRSGNQKTHNVVNYKRNLKIPKEYYDDDKHGTIQAMAEALGTRGKTSRDKNGFALYVGGFATYTTGDTAYIWSNSHTALNGSTVDNLSTGAFTATTFETLWRLLVEQASQDGEAGGHVPTAFLVPPILAPDAQEILKSELQAGTAENQLNYWSQIYPGLQVFSSIYLGSTFNQPGYANANTAHYLVSQNHGLTRWVREALYTRLVGWETDDNDEWTYKAGFREVVGARSWEGAVGSTGA